MEFSFLDVSNESSYKSNTSSPSSSHPFSSNFSNRISNPFNNLFNFNQFIFNIIICFYSFNFNLSNYNSFFNNIFNFQIILTENFRYFLM